LRGDEVVDVDEMFCPVVQDIAHLGRRCYGRGAAGRHMGWNLGMVEYRYMVGFSNKYPRNNIGSMLLSAYTPEEE